MNPESLLSPVVQEYSSQKFWDREGRRVLRVEMLKKRVTAVELAKLMRDNGFETASVGAISHRIARGTFSFGFALKALLTLGVTNLDIAHCRPDAVEH